MNHFLATYVDLIQSIGFNSTCAFTFFALYIHLSDNKKENCIFYARIAFDE